MCEALRELFAEELKEADSRGRSEGMRQGRQQGLTQGIRLTKRVLQLSSQGDAPEIIAEKCNISLEGDSRLR